MVVATKELRQDIQSVVHKSLRAMNRNYLATHFQ